LFVYAFPVLDSSLEIGDLLNSLKGHLFFGNLSFNFEVVALDVDDCCALVSSSIVGICGLFSKKYIESTLQLPIQNGIHLF